MLFAINYSEAAADLLRRGLIQIDAFKLPPWPELLDAARPLAPRRVHFDLNTAQSDGLRRAEWDAYERLLDETGTPYLNVHLAAACAAFPHIPPQSRDPAHRAEVQARLLDDLGALTRRFGAARVIAENVPHHGARAKFLRLGSEPEVITALLDAADCGLLLDIGHARISAAYMDIPEADYFAALPLGRLRELHATGLAWVDGERRDHYAMQAADWAALDGLLAEIAAGTWPEPGLLAFEYGGVGAKFLTRSDPAVIAAQAPQFWARLAAFNCRAKPGASAA
jgi:uncharacterized protein (UPF0276 family)